MKRLINGSKLSNRYLKEAYKIVNNETKIKPSKRHLIVLIDHYAHRPEVKRNGR